MKGVAFLALVAVVIVVVAGVMVYRSTAPTGDVVPAGEANLEEEATESAPGQFLQLEPEDGPPGLETPSSEEAMEAKETAVEGAEPVSGSEASGETVTVSMTDTGLVPANVTIDVGTTIEFINNGQARHWPASAVHPVHTILSAFDSKRGITTGDSYSFTFTEAGSWNWHDHLNPTFVGTIIVE